MNQFHRTSRLQPRLAVTALLLAGMAMAVAATTRAEAADQAPTHTVVAQGEPTELARFQGSAWTKGDGCLECGGMDNFLFADELTFLGDFKVKVRMSLTGVKNSAASFCIGEHSHFGFDGGGGPMFVQGPALGRTTRFVGEYTDFLTEGEPFDFEVTRQDGKLAISIDGKQAYQQKSTGLLGPVGLRPWRATMRVYDLTITGEAARLPEITQPRAYTIPTIDLSHQKHRQVIVERKPGQYLGHPTTVLMPDCKTIYCTYPLGHGGPAAVLKKSTDGGLTWSDRLPVPDNWSTARNCPCIHRLTDPQGVERLFVFEGNGAMRQAHSLDGGKTWTPFEPNGLHCVVAPITIVPIEGDRLLAMYHRGAGDRDRPPLELWQSISDDGGLTWGPETKVADYPAGNPCEPFVLRSPDGKQLVALARENARRYNSLMIKSDDDGKTWSQPVQLPASLTGDRHMGRYGPDGRLVICFRDTAYESPTRGDFVAWVGTYDDIVNLREGQYRVRLLRSPRKGDLGYPGMELLPDGTFVATTYAVLAPGEKNSVVSVRFTLEEIDEEATRLPEQIDVFTSGEDGYHTYRIPAVLVTPEGTVLAFCEGRKGSRSDTGDIDLLLKRSTDGGRTFSKQQIVWNDGPNTCGNPCSVIDRTTGKIHLLLTHNLGVDTEREIVGRKSEGTRTVWVATSDDDGESWSKPREITESTKNTDDWTWYATGPGIGVQLRSNRLLIPCDHINSTTGVWASHVIFSDDHGKSWKLGGAAPPKTNECQAVELADGRVLLNMRNYNREHKCRALATSADGGETFSEVAYDEALVEPVCQASILRDSTAENGGKSRILFSNPGETDKRKEMTVRLSYDECKTWPVGKVLWAGPAAYSCLGRLGDGTMLCLYERGLNTPYEKITLARFGLEWLTDGKDTAK